MRSWSTSASDHSYGVAGSRVVPSTMIGFEPVASTSLLRVGGPDGPVGAAEHAPGVRASEHGIDALEARQRLLDVLGRAPVVEVEAVHGRERLEAVAGVVAVGEALGV